jgi:uncharacterized protein (TIGR03435 family)
MPTLSSANVPEHHDEGICRSTLESRRGYVHSSVLDSTGLEGGWNFTLSFSSAGQVRPNGPGNGQTGGGDSIVPDPNGGISLADAIRLQLGLKLEEQERPVKVMVIDHIEGKPTRN